RNLKHAALGAALVLLAVTLTLSLLAGWRALNPGPKVYTQWDIDNAVKHTLENTPPGPDQTTIAAAIIAPSLVRVEGFLSPERREEMEKEEALAARKAGRKPPTAQEKDAEATGLDGKPR